MSLVIALVGYLVLAAVSILDKFILNKTLPRTVVFVFYSCIFVLPIFLLVPFGVEWPRANVDWAVAVASGFSFALGLWATYASVKNSEISHSGPLIGGATAMFTLMLSRHFLGEEITVAKSAGIFVLLVGSALISFEKSETHNGWHIGMLWAMVSGLLFAVSHVAAKYIYDGYGFYSGLVWTRGFIGVFGLLLLLAPAVRKEIFRPRVAPARKKANNFFVVAADKLLGVAGVLLVQYAIAVGSVTVVNALAGVQYAILIVSVALLSKFAPKVFNECYGKKEMAMEGAAVLLIAAGLALIL